MNPNVPRYQTLGATTSSTHLHDYVDQCTARCLRSLGPAKPEHRYLLCPLGTERKECEKNDNEMGI